MTGPVGYWEVDDMRKTVEELQDAGAQVTGDVRDVGGGKLVATVTDPDGNMIGVVQSP
jgi:predicted enzyme related to lactoylglutathione lyase